MKWKRLPKEFERGNFAFSGKPLITANIHYYLPPEEIKEIITKVRNLAKENMAVDYIQVFENENKQKVICIDNVSLDDIEAMKDSGQYTTEEIQAQNYWLMLYDYLGTI